MKTLTSILALFISSITTALPQGVIHLNQGDSYLFSNPKIVGGLIDESGLTQFFIHFGFTGDQFALGESAHVDILGSTTSTTPLFSTDFTNTINNPGFIISTNKIVVISTGIPWIAYYGAIQFTMVSGGVDISSLTASTWYNYQEVNYAYTIPEPSAPLLLIPGLFYVFLRQRRFSLNKRV